MTFPNVARPPYADATCLASSTVAAYGSIGSLRSASRVVPAWSARPVKSSRQRPCGQMPSAIPTAAPSPSSALPCSMCSSTNAPRLASRSSSAPSRAGSSPAPAIASARVTPSPSRSARAADGCTAPVSSLLPRQARPNRPPSSSQNAATATGRAGVNPCARS